jgi:hypothetical protein
MTKKQIGQPDEWELAKLLRASLGPEEDWDDAAVELVLDLCGINPEDSTERLKRAIDNVIMKKRDHDEHIPDTLLRLQQKLEQS